MPPEPRRWRGSAQPCDQPTSDADQTASDSDQTASDTDQSISDRGEAAAQADQRASDREQAASDREMRASPTEDENRLDSYKMARVERGEGTLARIATALVREQIGAERDVQAMRRDDNARRRDEAASERDEAAGLADRTAEELAGAADEPDLRVKHALEAAAEARRRAAGARVRAAEDRRRAARDRGRLHVIASSLRPELERSHLDELTGAYRRGIGEVILRHEIERAKRSRGSLVFVRRRRWTKGCQQPLRPPRWRRRASACVHSSSCEASSLRSDCALWGR